MKNQFAIKSAQASKETIFSAAKNESANVLKFLAKAKECCAWAVFQGVSPKTTFSL